MTHLKKALILALALAVLAGCVYDASDGSGEARQYKYSYTFMGAFDTVFQALGFAESQEEFDAYVSALEDRIKYLHKLFDIYNDYDGMNNAKTVNDNAGIAPVKVDPALLGLVGLYIDWYGKLEGTVDASLGPVLKIWHDYREEGLSKPPVDALEKARELCGVENIELDLENETIFLKKAGMSLDLGACGKGYAAGLAVSELPEGTSFLLNAGGNVVASGKPLDGRDAWSIGISDPDGEIFDQTPPYVLPVASGCVVTSGDYQRYYIVEGEVLCHIIDPSTLFPASRFRSVTVVCPDSGVADLLSTCLFILPYEEGRALIDSLGFDAVWIFSDKSIMTTDGIKDKLAINN